MSPTQALAGPIVNQGSQPPGLSKQTPVWHEDEASCPKPLDNQSTSFDKTTNPSEPSKNERNERREEEGKKGTRDGSDRTIQEVDGMEHVPVTALIINSASPPLDPHR